MKHESVETLDTDVPDDASADDIQDELRDMVRTTSFSNCLVEELDVCNTTRSLKGSTENLARNCENVIRSSRRGHCKKDVVCTLYNITESPTTGRKHSLKNGSSISVSKEDNIPIPTISGAIDTQSNHLQNSEELLNEKSPPQVEQQITLWDSVKGIAVLYANPVYILISICMSTYVIIFIPLLTVIVDYSMDKGIPESSGKYLINAMAFGDLIGRLCFGWVTDKALISIPVFMTLLLVLEGLVIVLFPYAVSVYSLSLLLILYGITAGCVLVHFPLLVLKYVDVNLQSVAMGCVGFLSGIVSFGIPLMIGYFRDNVGSYDGMFYLTGVISVVSGGLWLFVPMVARKHHKNEKKRAIAESEKAKSYNNGVANSNQQKHS